ncbi:hypothetical protein RDI58_020377 [Solanum bulbocastanum]|uniref:Uncharacterized protein n=1 Tax=Solanum bulbocastanum TaxID=147425 RepID=A0AAN8TBZ3_SOLBU
MRVEAKMFDRKPIVVKPWKPNIELNEEIIDKVRVWIRLIGLDIKHWGKYALTKITGLIGNPIKADATITNKANLAYVRGLLETKIKRNKAHQASLNLCRDWSFTTNISAHPGGRIWMVWKPNTFAVNIIHCDAQMIHSEIMHWGSGRRFWVTMVYGFNEQWLRKQLWMEIEKISTKMGGTWAVMGDFNSVLNVEERLGKPATLAEIRDFRQCTRKCYLQDLKSLGKSNLFSANMEKQILEDVCELKGTLPFRYLGVRISSKKTSTVDCEILVDKLTSRVKTWGTRNLSYAGISFRVAKYIHLKHHL